MLGNFTNIVTAELFQLRKRSSTWTLLGIWTLLATFFGYLLPYLIENESGGNPVLMNVLLPENLVPNLITGVPFYGGAIALMVGVLSVGSEYNWGTYKTMFTQRPRRSMVISARVVAISLILMLFAVVPFIAGAISSVIVANLENAAISWPAAGDLVMAILASWLILFTWAAVGIFLATVTRGTSMAIGIGIIYALMLEGLIGNFADNISWLSPLINVFLRANGYSLIEPLFAGGVIDDGPGGFTGPFLGVTQSLIALGIWIVASIGASLWLIRSRDVT